MQNQSERIDRKTCFYLLFWAAFLILVLTNATPLRNNAWADSSVFFTAGLGIINGQVMYRDMFDHKGLYIHLINALGALINRNTFFGVFLLEIIFMAASAFIILKIYRQFYLTGGGVLAAQLVTLLIAFPPIIEGGNLTEEYTLPFQFLSIYLLVKYLKSGEIKHKPLFMFVHGLNVGIVMNLRPNHVIMWLPIAILILARLIYHKEYSSIMQNLFSGLAGIFAGCLPVIVYAAVNNIFYEVIEGTFLYSLTKYIDVNASFIANFCNILFNKAEWILMLLILFSCFIVGRNRERCGRIYYFSMLFVSIAAISMSGYPFGHYYMYITPFAMPVIFRFAELLSRTRFKRMLQFAMVFLLASYGTLKFMSTYDLIPGYASFYKWVTPVYNQMNAMNKAQYQGSLDDEKVLVTGNSCIYYIKLGVLPHHRYYYVPLGKSEEARNAQIDSILSGENDVIICNLNSPMFADSSKLDEIKNFLQTRYNLLYENKNEEENLQMYGRKK